MRNFGIIFSTIHLAFLPNFSVSAGIMSLFFLRKVTDHHCSLFLRPFPSGRFIESDPPVGADEDFPAVRRIIFQHHPDKRPADFTMLRQRMHQQIGEIHIHAPIRYSGHESCKRNSIHPCGEDGFRVHQRIIQSLRIMPRFPVHRQKEGFCLLLCEILLKRISHHTDHSDNKITAPTQGGNIVYPFPEAVIHRGSLQRHCRSLHIHAARSRPYPPALQARG